MSDYFEHIIPDLAPLVGPLDELTPDPNNANVHDEKSLQAIATSLAQFKQREPIICQRRGDEIIIRAGNGRWEAAKELGWTHIARVIINEPDELAKAYAITDNKSAQFASWDSGRLADILQEISDESETLFRATGFSDEELTALLCEKGEAGDSGKSSPAAGEAEIAQWPVEPGQVWLLGGHRIMCGDSTNPDDVAQILAGAKPGLMVTDPPYGVEYDPEWRIDAGLNQDTAADGVVLNDDRADWQEAWDLFPGDVAYPRYLAICIARWAEMTGETPVLEAT